MKQERSLRNFLPYLMQFKGRISLVFLCLILAKVANVTAPWFLKSIVDYLQESLTTVLTIEGLLWLVGFYFLARIASSAFNEGKEFLFARVEARISRNVARDIFEHLINLSVAFHLNKKTGSVAAKIERGLRGISFIFRFSIFNILPTIVEILLVVAILLYNYHWSYALTTLVTLLIYIGFTIYIAEQRSKVQREMNTYSNQTNAKSIDSLINIETVKYFTNEKKEVKEYDKGLAELEHSSLQTKNFLYITNLGQAVIITTGLIILLSMAAIEVFNKTMTIGDFTLVTIYMSQLAIPLGFLGFVYRQIRESLVNMEDMFSLLNITDRVEEHEDAYAVKDFKKQIELKDVTFSYGGERTVLDTINMTIEKGSKVALVGHSGSGKSSISKVLLRLYDIADGAIFIDNHDTRNMTLKSLRDLIGIVPQDTVLFNDTIMRNIQYGRPNATKKEVISAAKKAHIHTFIMSLPDGYDTKVGERGLRLSGGEKQRIAIARVLLKGSPILLFDEATSSLDSKSEAIITEAIESVSKEKTVIVIAHRLSTIAKADKIYVLEAGVVMEEGTHRSLLAKKGYYHDLWTTQQEQVSPEQPHPKP